MSIFKNISFAKKILSSHLFAIYIALMSGLLLYFLPQDLGRQPRVVLATFGVAGVLWLSEAIPLYVTSFVISFILIFFGRFSSVAVFKPFFDPIIVLFLGGFVLARSFHKYKVDLFISDKILHLVGHKPYKVMLGLMVLSAFLSMWMSNTASAALLLPIGIQILVSSKIKKSDPLYKAFPLAIAYAATTGGLATIIGSPPNALAVKYLVESGVVMEQISFVDWMQYMLPVAILILVAIFVVIKIMYRSSAKSLEVPTERVKLSKKGRISLIVTLIVVILWLTGKVTGISASLAALLPIIFFFGSQLLKTKDLQSLHWDTILLFGGGLTLGEAVMSSGVNEYIAGGFEHLFMGISTTFMYGLIVFIGILFTIVASNTGAAVVMLPIVISLSTKLGLDPMILVGLTTVGVSLDFILPVGTPPSAIAYSSGYIKSKEMVRTGLILTIFVVLIPTLVALYLW